MSNAPAVSVVVPVFNEEENVAILQDELERLINALLQDAEPLDPPMAA